MTALAALALCAAIAIPAPGDDPPPCSAAGPCVSSVIQAPAPACARLLPVPAPLQQEDRWLAEDKLRHFLASFGGTNLAFGALRTAGLDREPAMAGAAAAALAAGLWKEWRDRRAGGLFSGKDLVWDGLGILAGLALASATR
ncbi:MAG TPA: hypothetical protein VIL18_10880 [Longimicrobiales bacterium]